MYVSGADTTIDLKTSLDYLYDSFFRHIPIDITSDEQESASPRFRLPFDSEDLISSFPFVSFATIVCDIGWFQHVNINEQDLKRNGQSKPPVVTVQTNNDVKITSYSNHQSNSRHTMHAINYSSLSAF